MPFSKTRIFLEETSLVARPAIPFPELKRRLDARMAHMGIKVWKHWVFLGIYSDTQAPFHLVHAAAVSPFSGQLCGAGLHEQRASDNIVKHFENTYGGCTDVFHTVLFLSLFLQHLGFWLQIRAIEEEEYCLIPMGGVLPRVPQRVLGIGGTAGMVHPSTGVRLSQRSVGSPAELYWTPG